MSLTSREIAEEASFQAFLNCYVREVEPGQWYPHTTPSSGPLWHLALPLKQHQGRLWVEVHYRSLAGRHRFGQAWLLMGESEETRLGPLNPFTALLLLTQEAYRGYLQGSGVDTHACELEMLYRLVDSWQMMAAYLQPAMQRATPCPSQQRFIEAEQSLVYGHWLHPTPKSRQGMADWQQSLYAPELGGRFQLHWFAAPRQLIAEGGLPGVQLAQLVEDLLGEDQPDLVAGEGLLPVHPLQAQWLLEQPWLQPLLQEGRLRSLGPLGREFSATSSVRTLYAADCAWMLKCSIPVRVTNSVRVNRAHELEAGVAMQQLLDRSAALSRYPSLRLLADPAYLTLKIAGRAESGFEVIFRENPFTPEDKGVITLAALCADPLPGQASALAILLSQLAEREGRSLEQVASQWFERYLQISFIPLISLYSDEGLALEAHQQNSLVDVSQGYPSCYYYRDNQGYYLSQSQQARICALVPGIEQIPALFFSDAQIQQRFAYYLLINQLGGLISRLGNDQLLDEAYALSLVVRSLSRLRPSLGALGRSFIDYLLSHQQIPAKGNLLTRLYDVDELEASNEQAVYSLIDNPLLLAEVVALQEPDYAVA